MKQLNVFCEGQTEQGFCAQVLQPHLFPSGDGIVHTLAVGEKSHHHIYGIGRRTRYEKVRKFILNTIKQREGKNVYFTTLVDLMGCLMIFPARPPICEWPPTPLPMSSLWRKRSRVTSTISVSFPIFSFTSTRPFCSPIRKHFASHSRTAKRKLSSSRQSLPRSRASNTSTMAKRPRPRNGSSKSSPNTRVASRLLARTSRTDWPQNDSREISSL